MLRLRSLRYSGIVNAGRVMRSRARRVSSTLAIGWIVSLTWLTPHAEATAHEVNTAGDAGDNNLTDGVCNDGSGHCTFRAALEQSNQSPGPDEILFAIGSGPKTLNLFGSLPVITGPVIIDGTTQPGFDENPIIEIHWAGPTDQHGLVIHADGCTVRGLVINGFDAFERCGILIENANGGTIEGNFIGTNLTGTAPIPNGYGIRMVNTSNVTIGGDTPDARNVISGNYGEGVHIAGPTSTGNKVYGNYIGTDATGMNALGNISPGVDIYNAPDNRIGGVTFGTRNVISANPTGIAIGGPSARLNRVQGNYVGTNKDGEPLLGNTFTGVLLTEPTAFPGPASENLIGGTEPGAGNLIAGNGENGLVIAYGGSQNRVEGNRIRRNAFHGVLIRESPNNVIGGPNPTQTCATGPCNEITSNGLDGVKIRNLGASGNRVQGNFIGRTAANGPGGNALYGVEVLDISGNIIGAGVEDGVAPGLGNVIAHNTKGVVISGESVEHSTIRANSIFENAEIGIDLEDDGVTPNDNVVNGVVSPPDNAGNDADTGPNGLLNFPVGVTAEYRPELNTTIISGVVSTATLNNILVDIYASRRVDDAQHYQAERYLGRAFTGSTGVFRLDYPGQLPAGYVFLTATATQNDSTSELTASVCRDVPFGDVIPGNPDNDGDGLCDNWESQGIDFNGDGASDLRLPDADPDRKNLYVEVDFLNQPRSWASPGALVDVMQAFADAPVSNPSGATGIILRAVLDDAIPPPVNQAPNFGIKGPSGPEAPDDFDDIKRGIPSHPCDGYFGTGAERNAANCADILAARQLVYRYCVFADRYSDFDNSGSIVDKQGVSGVAELGGNDFIVSLGDWDADDRALSGGGRGTGPYNCTDCSRVVQAGTFMHELGHTLGRGHGGMPDDEKNRKPNYLSVMNYTFQNRGNVPSRPLDYSRWLLPPGSGSLDENHLVEVNGITDLNPPPDLSTRWPDTAYTYFDAGAGECKYKTAPPAGAIDWDNNANPYNITSAGINDLGGDTCQTSPSDLLAGFDDWQSNPTSGLPLHYSFRSSPAFSDDPAPTRDVRVNREDELSNEDARTMADLTDYDLDGISNLIDNCLTAPNLDQQDADGDGMGDLCDGCPGIPSTVSDTDADSDGVGDACDNCPHLPNAAQGEDSDSDGIGDACDNCLLLANAAQSDCNGDGIGDDCAADCDDDGAADDCTISSQIAQLVASDATMSGWFGHEVAIDGDTAVVAAERDATGQRATYVLVRDPETPGHWVQQAILHAGEQSNFDFRHTLAISGDTILLGVYWDDGLHGEDDQGAVYVFVRHGNTWTQQARLSVSDAVAHAGLGACVALDGDTALVSAAGFNAGQGAAAYVFTRSGAHWTQQARLAAADAYALGVVGSCVALDGDTALVGGYIDEDYQDAAYVFVRGPALWSEQAKLVGSVPGEQFDSSGFNAVALSGDTALVGDPSTYTDPVSALRGLAHVFVRTGNSWAKQATLRGSGLSDFAHFGNAVALDGDTALIAAYRNDGPDGPSQGAAYLFARQGSTWTEQRKLTAEDGAEYREFGGAVALSGSQALIADISYSGPAGEQQGTLYVFSFPDCDTNGVPDTCQPDCNSDGIPDACASGGDADLDGIPDVCDPCPNEPANDFDCDGEFDLVDLVAFVHCQSGPIAAAAPECLGVFDFDDNGFVDLADWAAFQVHFTGP